MMGQLLLSIFLGGSAYAHVKATYPKVDELLNIKTAIGIATIVQVPEPIQSAIIGDQSGFKGEYLDRAVTIKPLRHNAKTNLYLVTEKRRYNLTLVPSAQNQADYVVYIKEKVVAPSVKWQDFVREVKSENLSLKINRVGISNDGAVLLDGLVSSKTTEYIKPQNVWIYQGTTSRVINSLFLSDRKVTRHRPARFALSVLKSEFDMKSALTLTLKNEKPLSVELPESLWK